MVPFSITPNGINFIMGGKPKTVAKEHANFTQVKEAVVAGNVKLIEKLIDSISFVAKITNGKVLINDEKVMYDGREVPEYLAHRIIEHSSKGEKLMQNPNKEIVQDLFRWMEVGNMPVYPDGDFVGYKVVRSDFTPIHRGPYGQSQKPGEVVEMPRSECDENRNQTCSTGLHFCSYDYLSNFNGFDSQNVIVYLKINPKDVTSIPTDYNNTKGRTCRFEVVDVLEKETIKETFNKGVVATDDQPEVDQWDFYEEMTDSWEDVDSWEDEVVISTPSAKPADTSDEVEFARNGKTYTAKLIIETVEREGVTKASRELDIPRSTLSSWYAKSFN